MDMIEPEELATLKLENKKLKRENKHLQRDNEMLRMANEQAAHIQEFVQRDNMRQLFYNDQMLKTSPYIMILTDEHLQLVMASEMFFLFTGEDASRIESGFALEDSLRNFMEPDELQDFMKQCKDALAGEYIPSYIYTKDLGGPKNYLQITIRAMRNAEGEVPGLNIIFVDMTEMIEAREHADEANKAKSSFLANMSHEIRTPINAVLGMDEMILRESSEPQIRSYAGNIRQAGKTLLALINEILDFSKVEEGKMEIIPTRYELGSLVNDVVNMVTERVKKKGLELKVDIDQEIPHELFGDEIRIKQCILNVLNNSVKYTEKGQVGLEMGFARIDDQRITLKVKVTDTGIGMKKEDLERLFAPFTRIEEKRNRNIEGTGLGMNITKSLLELMGTSLHVESEYGVGSEFSFDIEQKILSNEPIGDYAENFKCRYEDVSDEVYKPQFYAPSARILVVDDTETNLLVIKSLLKATGVQVDTVSSGHEALIALDYAQYDIIFVDHMMPEMDGIETLEEMKKRDDYDRSTHIALTANAISGSRERYLSYGFDDYLSKPVDGTLLEKTMMRYIDPSKLASEEEALASQEAVSSDDQADVIPDWLWEIDGVDVSEGIKNCGDAEGLMDIARSFHDTAQKKKQDIVDAYREERWKDYTIFVHAMKSSARLIGAMELSEMSRKLEDAGNAQDIDYIKSHSDEMISLLEQIDEGMTGFDEAQENLNPISESQLKEAYQVIYDFSQKYDHKMIEALLDSIKEYSLEKEDEEVFAKLKDMLMVLDWDGMAELMKDVLSERD